MNLIDAYYNEEKICVIDYYDNLMDDLCKIMESFIEHEMPPLNVFGIIPIIIHYMGKNKSPFMITSAWKFHKDKLNDFSDIYLCTDNNSILISNNPDNCYLTQCTIFDNVFIKKIGIKHISN